VVLNVESGMQNVETGAVVRMCAALVTPEGWLE
jgi:hypothetical protein